MSYKFKVGQLVRFTPGAHERNWAGLFHVMAKLPDDRGDQQYRIKSVKDEHQRVVRESQIAAQ